MCDVTKTTEEFSRMDRLEVSIFGRCPSYRQRPSVLFPDWIMKVGNVNKDLLKKLYSLRRLND